MEQLPYSTLVPGEVAQWKMLCSVSITANSIVYDWNISTMT